MKRIIKLVLTAILIVSTLLSVTSCGLLKTILVGSDEERFYNLVYETQSLIDELGDAIYQNWYDSIYKDDFNGDIDEAIDAAFEDNEDALEKILQNTDEIEKLYKKIKKGDMADEAKEVMNAYNEYYTLVVEVSGSFNTYSESKEPAKKALSTALRNYYSAL